jgi:hypothetical protein
VSVRSAGLIPVIMREEEHGGKRVWNERKGNCGAPRCDKGS